jgi:hypothetical protein
MSIRKTKVTRMSRRKARSGTRKRRGGFSFNPLNWFANKTDVPNTVAPAAAPAVPAAVPAAVPSDPAKKPGFFGWFSGGGGKTRHRRRRHRK